MSRHARQAACELRQLLRNEEPPAAKTVLVRMGAGVGATWHLGYFTPVGRSLWFRDLSMGGVAFKWGEEGDAKMQWLPLP